MNTVSVRLVNLVEPVRVVGKNFVGDYRKSSSYIMEVQADLGRAGIPVVPNRVLGIYFDNPYEKKPEELRSFQAVFAEPFPEEIPDGLSAFVLTGKCVCAVAVGDPSSAVMEGYDALFKFIGDNAVALRSQAACQISTYDHGTVTTEIYMEAM